MDAKPSPAPSPPPSTSPAQRPPAPLARRLLTPLVTLAGVAAAFTYVGTVDPNEPGHYPACPLLQLTGIYCPGCGGLRSAHGVATGDLAGAFGANAMAVVGYAICAVLWAVWMIRSARGLPMRINVKPVFWWSLGAVAVIFSIVRNLPFGSVLAP